jgi:hypothetical protein
MRSRASNKATVKGLLAAGVVAALALVAPLAEAAAAPVLEPTGSMATERYKAAAAPLPGGDALVVGGLHHVSLSSLESESLASAERYDGATGTFAPTGSMAVSRMDPAAAPLPDGRVLVLGGQVWGGGGTPLASAEIYDPASGEFTVTGSMAVTRFGAMAAPLPDGRVLVAGGYGSGSEASAEIYDPETGEFSPTGAMVAGRAFGMAAPLADGSVLIVARGSGEDALTTEIYDPLTGTFAIGSAETSAPLHGAGGSLDDGRVLFFSERRAGETSVEQSFEYDPAAGALVEPAGAPALTVERPAVAPLPGGRMLVAGGSSQDAHAYEGQGIVPSAAIYTEGPVRSGATTETEAAVSGAAASASTDPSSAAPRQSSTQSPAKPKAKKLCKRAGTHGKRSHRARCGVKGPRKPAP